MPVVVISGRIGSQARPIGREVAQLLGADYVDHQILAEAARKAGSTVEVMEQKDERPSSTKEKIARFFHDFLEKSAAAGTAGDPLLGPMGIEVLMARSLEEEARPAVTSAQELSDARFTEILTSTVKELAASGNVVIIGRGGNIILRDRPKTTHVYVVSTWDSRVNTTMKREGLDKLAAEKFVKKAEADRVSFYRKLFKANPDDPLLYHLILNVERLGNPVSARIIADAARDIEAARCD